MIRLPDSQAGQRVWRRFTREGLTFLDGSLPEILVLDF
jgi:hypothetical protein